MQVRSKLQQWREAAGDLWSSHRAFIAVALPGILTALAVFFLTSVGHTFNAVVFVKPGLKLRNLWQLAEAPAEKLRIIVYDDSSAEALAHPPSIDDWIGIANQLSTIGFKKVIFPGAFELPPEARTLKLRDGLEFIAGGAVHSRSFKDRNSVPPGVLPVSSNSDVMTSIPQAGDILHAEHLEDMVSNTGSVNLSGDLEIRAGYRVQDHSYIPHVAFYAAPELRVSGDRLTSRAGVLPLRLDGSMYIEMHDPAKIGKISLPVRSFYYKGPSGLREHLTVSVKKALDGGEVALFVADGNTGSAAFIDSFAGLVPTYYANASLISSVMHNRFLRDLPEPRILIVFTSLVIALCGLVLRPLRFMAAVTALWLMLIAGSVLLFHVFALVAPLAQLSAVCFISLLAAQVQHSFQTWQQDLRRQRDLELGKIVQSLTLPQRMQGHMGRWEFAVAYEPYGPMSGDWVQVYENRNPEHDICGIIAIGDVVGKGPAAALNTASIAALWNHFRSEWDEGHFDILNFLRTLNRNIYSTFGGNQSTSVAVAILHKDKVRLINCGSPSWISISPDNKVESVRTPPSNPLGMTGEDTMFPLRELELEPGCILLAHTDGVMEGGLARKNFARNILAAGMPEEQTFAYLQREARIAGAETVLPDDFTMLYLKRSA